METVNELRARVAQLEHELAAAHAQLEQQRQKPPLPRPSPPCRSPALSDSRAERDRMAAYGREEASRRSPELQLSVCLACV